MASNVARRYAEGVFQLAQDERAIDTWRGELAKLEEILREPTLIEAFANPAISLARRMALAKQLAPVLSPGAENLLRLLIDHQRTHEMPEIRRQFEQLADDAAGIVHAALTTAVPLTDALRDRYQQALTRGLRRQVRVRTEVDPGLIGGATIQIGDRLTDGSIRTQLARLREELVG